MRATRRGGVDVSDPSWVMPPVCEFLETRRLFAAGDLALVHQELHRPPVLLADLDGDGQAEFILAEARKGANEAAAIATLRASEPGSSTYTLSSRTVIFDEDVDPVEEIQLAAGDVDGDGRADVVALTWTVDGTGPDLIFTPELHILHGDGKGGFDGQRELTLPEVMSKKCKRSEAELNLDAIARSRVAVGDVNGDGTADIVVGVGNDLAVAVSRFGFGPRQSTSIDGSFSHPNDAARFIGIGDMDRDGRLDLVAVADEAIEYAPVDLDAATGQAALGKISKVDAVVVKQGVRVAVGDLNGDGAADLIMTVNDRSVARFINAGGGKFESSPVQTDPPANALDVILGDLDGDGLDDIVAIALVDSRGLHVTVLK